MRIDSIPPWPEGIEPQVPTEGYAGTFTHTPAVPPIRRPPGRTELTAPRDLAAKLPCGDDNLAVLAPGRMALGQYIHIAGRILDEDARPVPHAVVELWQANAAGRYAHPRDTHDAPADPNFPGEGRIFTDAEGNYRFVSIKPGAYPWRNHHNAWRPIHIHLSLFGEGFAQRLITQMYFPGDPLLPLDPVFNAVPDAAARDRLVSRFDLALTEPEWALGYRFDIVLRGRGATPFEAAR